MEEDPVFMEGASTRAAELLRSAERRLRVADASLGAMPRIIEARREAIALGKQHPEGVSWELVADWEKRVLPPLSDMILTRLGHPLEISVAPIDLRLNPNPSEGCVFWMANHPSTWSIFTLYDWLRKHGPFRFVVKKELHPNHARSFKEQVEAHAVGAALAALDKAVFIDRDSREGRSNIDDFLKNQFSSDSPSGLMLFPDGSRFTEKKRKTDLERFGKNHNLEWMTHTCFPRSGGAWTILDALRASGGPFSVRDLTIMEPPLVGQREFPLHIEVEDISAQIEKCLNEKDLGAFLRERWALKNKLIRKHHQRG